MVSQADYIIEAVKLAAQLIGAVVIARLTVSWALSRYKAEKLWERRLGAYADAVTAISEMRTVVGQWFDDAITRSERSEEITALLATRYRTARKKLEEGLSAGLLLLPQETADLLSKLIEDLDRSSVDGGYEAALDHDWGLLDVTLKQLLEIGRRDLK